MLCIEASSGARGTLRKLELEAYGSVISAFRAQGQLTKDKKCSLEVLCKCLGISAERHRAEVRRAVNDELLSVVACCVSGVDNDKAWRKEGQKLSSQTPCFVTHRTLGHAPQALAAAASARSLLATHQGGSVGEEPGKRKIPASIQNALRVIISHKNQQGPKSSAPPSLHVSPEKVDTPTVMISRPEPVEVKGEDKGADVGSVNKGKGYSQLESLLCEEYLASRAEFKSDSDKQEEVESFPTTSHSLPTLDAADKMEGGEENSTSSPAQVCPSSDRNSRKRPLGSLEGTPPVRKQACLPPSQQTAHQQPSPIKQTSPVKQPSQLPPIKQPSPAKEPSPIKQPSPAKPSPIMQTSPAKPSPIMQTSPAKPSPIKQTYPAKESVPEGTTSQRSPLPKSTLPSVPPIQQAAPLTAPLQQAAPLAIPPLQQATPLAIPPLQQATPLAIPPLQQATPLAIPPLQQATSIAVPSLTTSPLQQATPLTVTEQQPSTDLSRPLETTPPPDSLISDLISDTSDTAVLSLASQLGLADNSLLNLSDFMSFIQPTVDDATPTNEATPPASQLCSVSTTVGSPFSVTSPVTFAPVILQSPPIKMSPHFSPGLSEQPLPTPTQRPPPPLAMAVAPPPLAVAMAPPPLAVAAPIPLAVAPSLVTTPPPLVIPEVSSPLVTRPDSLALSSHHKVHEVHPSPPQVSTPTNMATPTADYLDLTDIGALMGNADDSKLLEGIPEDMAKSIQTLCQLDQQTWN